MSPRSRLAIFILTVAYVVLAGAAVLDDRYLHDEGLLTHLLAQLVGRAPAATIFLQKARPPLALLYAPIAGLGLSAFLWAHVLVCALAVPLVGAAAAKLGHERPEWSAAIVALSPMHIAAGAAGLMNGDAVVFVALVAWLWAGKRMMATGTVAGLLVWVRAELVVLAVVLALWSAWRRLPRVWIGLVSFGVVYGLAGAVYHQDLLWMLHFPPALPHPMEGNPYWEAHHAEASIGAVGSALLSITPAIVMVVIWRPRHASTTERVGLLAMAILATALVVLPRWQVFNFDLSPRYLLPVLPFVALAVARALAHAGTDERAVGGIARGVGLGIVGGLALVIDRTGGGPASLVAVAMVATAVACAGAGAGGIATFVFGVVLAVGPLGFTDGARLSRGQQAAALDQAVVRLREHPEWAKRPLLTNIALLSAYLERSGNLPGRRVHYLVQADQLHELSALANPENGQRDAIMAALRQGFYGRPVFPDELKPGDVPAGAIFVLREDSRLSLVMPPEEWERWLSVVHPGPNMRIAERIQPQEAP